jgi:hypothetical protein
MTQAAPGGRSSTRTRARTRLRAAALAAIPLAAILATTVSPPAQADVDSVSGAAYAAAVRSSLLGEVIAPTPFVSGTATEPTNSFGPIDQSSLPVNIIGLLHIGVLNGLTRGDGVAADDPVGHFGFAQSRASAADIVVGLGSLTIDAVESGCTSNGDGSTGFTELVGAVLGGNPLITSPLPNTTVELPGILSIVLNEQTVHNAPGSTAIRVRALHITLLPGLGGLLGVVDVVIGESNCAASGPDVNSTTTSSTTTTPPPTNPPTTPPTTPPPTTPPTTPPPTAPPTIPPPTIPPPTSPPQTLPPPTVPPTLPPVGSTSPTVVTTVKPVVVVTTPLVRTGSDPMPMVALAVAAILLGLVAHRSGGGPLAPARGLSSRPAAYRPVGVLPATRRRRDGDDALDPAVAEALDALEDDGPQ